MSDEIDYGALTPHYRIDDPIPVTCCVVGCEKLWINCLRIEEIQKIFFSCYDHFVLLFNKGADTSAFRKTSVDGVDYEKVEIWKGSLPRREFLDYVTHFDEPIKLEQVKTLRKRGLSWMQIATELNVAVKELKKWRKKHMPES